MDLKGKKINFLGDSITQGVGASDADHVYHQVLKKNAGLAEARNYGLSGTRIARQQHPTEYEPSFDRDFCMRAAEMDPDADAVVVFGGTNDFGHGDAPLGTFADRTPATFYGALHTLFVTLIEKYPDVPVVVLTPMHRWNEDNPRGDNKPADVATLKTYVHIIREVAEYYSLPVLDLYASSGLQPQVPVIREKYVPDGLHPSDAGNARIALLLRHFLEAL